MLNPAKLANLPTGQLFCCCWKFSIEKSTSILKRLDSSWFLWVSRQYLWPSIFGTLFVQILCQLSCPVRLYIIMTSIMLPKIGCSEKLVACVTMMWPVCDQIVHGGVTSGKVSVQSVGNSVPDEKGVLQDLPDKLPTPVSTNLLFNEMRSKPNIGHWAGGSKNISSSHSQSNVD